MYTPSHHKSQVPIGLVAKALLIRHLTKKPIHNAADEILKKLFEVYDTDNPVREA